MNEFEIKTEGFDKKIKTEALNLKNSMTIDYENRVNYI